MGLLPMQPPRTLPLPLSRWPCGPTRHKDSKPWTWFYLKLLEKLFELVSIIVLSLTMMGGGSKKKKKAGPDVSASSSSGATAVVRTRTKKKPGAGAAKDEEAGGGAGGGVELTPAGSSTGLLKGEAGAPADSAPLVPGAVAE
jgi:hypothetical protein